MSRTPLGLRPVLFLLAAIPFAAPSRSAPSPAAPRQDSADSPRWCSLKYAEFDTSGPEPAMDADLAAPLLDPQQYDYFLAQLHPPVTELAKDQVRTLGGEVLDYIPNYVFIVRATGAARAAIAALPAVAWTGRFHPAYRLESTLRERSLDPRVAEKLERLTVHAFPGIPRATVEAQIAAAGATVTDAHDDTGRWIADVVGSAAASRFLAMAHDLQWIEPAATPVPRSNDTTQWVIQTNVTNSKKIFDKGLHGEGQIIGHIDGSIALTSCYFADPNNNPIGPSHRKIVYNNGSGTDSHGTHTAGTSAGDAQPVNGSTANRGMAYLAKLAHTSGFPTTTFNSVATTHANNGARVHTNSWGNDSTTAYETLCNQIDTFSWNNEDNLVLFASTNLSTLKNPENAKDLIAVNGSQNGSSSDLFCTGGTGPTADGRRKPELYAPGCSIVSAGTGSCSTSTLSGTSMACPAATGGAALVRQYFTEGWYPTGAKVPANALTPTGALIKAMLIDSGTNMNSISGYPSNQEGWGRILLDDAMFFAGDANKLIVKDVRKAQGLTTGQTKNYQFNVTSSSQPLSVTLVFHDFPGTVNAANPVINNLDLTVTAPGALQYKGNVITNGVSSTGGAADAKNNVERVLLPNPTLGAYTIAVGATSVPQPNQGFAVVITGAVSESAPGPSITSFSPNPIFNAAYPSTPILTITGQGFTGATNVQIGSVGYGAANFTVVNDSTISLDFNPPPLDVGLVNVQVTTPSGTSPAMALAITQSATRVCFPSKSPIHPGDVVTIYMASPNDGFTPLLGYSSCLVQLPIPPYVTYFMGGCGDLNFATGTPNFSPAGISAFTALAPQGVFGTFYFQFAELNFANPIFPLLTSNVAVLVIN